MNQGQRSKVKAIIMENVFLPVINGFLGGGNIRIIVGIMPIFLGRLPKFSYQLMNIKINRSPILADASIYWHSAKKCQPMLGDRQNIKVVEQIVQP